MATKWKSRFVVVRLHPTADYVTEFVDKVGQFGLAATADDLGKDLLSMVQDSPLRTMLQGNIIRSSRPIFSAQVFFKDQLASVQKAVHKTVDLRGNLQWTTSRNMRRDYRGHLLLEFETSEIAEQILSTLIDGKDPLVEFAHQPAERRLQFPERNSQSNMGTFGLQWWHEIIGPQLSAAGVRVAVVDSGVDDRHPDLTNVFPKVGSGIQSGDAAGHGTHCVGVVCARDSLGNGARGVCRPEEVISYQTYQGSIFSEAAYYDVLNDLLDDGVDVISLSIAGEEDPTETRLLNAAVEKNITICAAMGNKVADGPDERLYPAALSSERGIIAVGALDMNEQGELVPADFSIEGDHLTLMAPGTRVLSTFPTEFSPPYAWLDGTSMATPMVAGATAILKSKGLSSREIYAKLCDDAIPLKGQTKGQRSRSSGFGCISIR